MLKSSKVTANIEGGKNLSGINFLGKIYRTSRKIHFCCHDSAQSLHLHLSQLLIANELSIFGSTHILHSTKA